jgi:hypothetical protein
MRAKLPRTRTPKFLPCATAFKPESLLASEENMAYLFAPKSSLTEFPAVTPIVETSVKGTGYRSLAESSPTLLTFGIVKPAGEAEAGSAGEQPARE